MISVIMPYWDRLELLKKTLISFSDFYIGVDLEVIIADDGSGLSMSDIDEYHLDIKIINLTYKSGAKNPCVPLNRAAAAATGEFLAITNPEVIHTTPVLEQLCEQVASNGPTHYCSAGVWSADKQKWYNHSVENTKRTARAPTPSCAGLHFLAVMKTDFFRVVGGFDETYRDGQGYEDSDFLWKLHASGGTFSIRDDLVVEHVSTNTAWPAGGTKRNSGIFYKKWRDYMSIVGAQTEDA